MDKTDIGRNRPYCWLFLQIAWTKTKKLFSPNQKICHKIICDKMKISKTDVRFFGPGYLAKILRKLCANRPYSEGWDRRGLPGCDSSGLALAWLNSTKPFEMAACRRFNGASMGGIGPFCKAYTGRFCAIFSADALHRMEPLRLVCSCASWPAVVLLAVNRSALTACRIYQRKCMRYGAAVCEERFPFLA